MPYASKGALHESTFTKKLQMSFLKIITMSFLLADNAKTERYIITWIRIYILSDINIDIESVIRWRIMENNVFVENYLKKIEFMRIITFGDAPFYLFLWMNSAIGFLLFHIIYMGKEAKKRYDTWYTKEAVLL